MVKASYFEIEESIKGKASLWVSEASFYSCSVNNTTYLIVRLKNRYYIHSGVPYSLWKDFKNANSLGSFYDNKIRNHYSLRVSN